MKKKGRILAVDNNKDDLYRLKTLLQPHVKELYTSFFPCQVPLLIKKQNFDVVILSLISKNHSYNNVLEIKILHDVLRYDPNACVIFIVAKGDVDAVIEVIKAGAVDAISRPCEDEYLVQKVLAIIHQKSTKTQHGINSKNTLAVHEKKLVFNSPSMHRIVDIINKVAPSGANILISGENGTGKELVARSIHQKSLRAEKLLMTVDIGSLSEGLFENELFGHAKGAYTDAKESMPGRFELAHGGTVFLDEIGNISLPVQAKLLSVIENREVTRVGENKSRPIDIRLICATNKSLHSMVQEESFRRDLLYRINTVEIALPPLRERLEDIPVLAAYFLKMYCEVYRKPRLKIDKSAIKCLQQHNWPGNIRELQNEIEKAVIFSDRTRLSDGDFSKRGKANNCDDIVLKSYNLEDIERQVINKVLRLHSGNMTHSAEALGITRAALYRRLKKYGI